MCSGYRPKQVRNENLGGSFKRVRREFYTSIQSYICVEGVLWYIYQLLLSYMANVPYMVSLASIKRGFPDSGKNMPYL